MTAARIDMARSALVAAEAAVGLRAPAVAVPHGVGAGDGPRAARRIGPEAEPGQEDPDPQRVVAVPAALSPLFPAGGIRRGTAVQVRGSTSVLLALAQRAGGERAWCALIGMPQVGLAAAAAAHLCLDRVVVVPHPGPDPAAVLGALVDGFDVVVLGACPALRERDRRTLNSRLRHRGAVLLTPASWPGADLVLDVGPSRWAGVGAGHGVLRERRVEVSATGGHAPPRRVQVHLGAEGVRPVPQPIPGVVAGRADLQQAPPAAAPAEQMPLWAEAG